MNVDQLTFMSRGIMAVSIYYNPLKRTAPRACTYSLGIVRTFKSCFLAHWRLFIGLQIYCIVIISARGTIRSRCTRPIDYSELTYDIELLEGKKKG